MPCECVYADWEPWSDCRRIAPGSPIFVKSRFRGVVEWNDLCDHVFESSFLCQQTVSFCMKNVTAFKEPKCRTLPDFIRWQLTGTTSQITCAGGCSTNTDDLSKYFTQLYQSETY
eukprot:TRINITY_DN13227_c0_g1_i5.p1 TRINITY_DN13227_c0_g1~~TRINITY_DN13227_c0_g1_i5.p1  ORF type:complete len:115 (-),score=1.55 TRINITY_DN13227_c0_g1_i5:42-386(-)